ncbi:MAG TPA: Rrf2 family transcriptional regulator [Dissulfurispiraceae bacterium]|nr:Rrf2 family transcriptional regulator [Dissulfurispiraceae bacterium]
MEITRETDYAIRCLLYLSKKKGLPTVVDEIAQEMSIPKSFLSKIVQKLSRAGLLESFRGIKGGFKLAREPEAISLLDVISAMQGPVASNKCAVDRRSCGFSCTCVVHPIWIELRKMTEDYLSKINFEDMKGYCR